MLLRHPRRSGEAFLNQYIEGKFLEGHPVIQAEALDKLHDWFRPLLEAEERQLISDKWKDWLKDIKVSGRCDPSVPCEKCQSSGQTRIVEVPVLKGTGYHYLCEDCLADLGMIW